MGLGSPGPCEIGDFRTLLQQSHGICDVNGPPLLDMGATYAVDVQRWRILSVQP
jgi:hypothetical protein